MKKLLLLSLLAAVAACKSAQSETEAIHAQVVLAPAVSASCVLFEVRDPADHHVLEKRWLSRADGDLQLAIYRASLPQAVELAARPYLDGDCTGGQEARSPNGSYQSVTATFVKGTVTQAGPLQLQPGEDSDGDGYVSVAGGGSDCDDARGAVKPSAAESCSDQRDLNCDGQRGCAASACGASACATPPAALMLNLSATVTGGDCVGGTVLAKDSNGAATRVFDATSIALQANPSGGLGFYSDAACTTPVTSASMAANEGTAGFYFKGNVVGAILVTASANGLAQGSQSVQVQPGAASRLVFLGSGQTQPVGKCSAVVGIQSQDAIGNVAPVKSATAVSLAASPAAGFKFYSDSACTTEVTSVTLASGASASSFYFKGTKSGTVTVSLSATGFSGGTQDETLNPGPPAGIALAGPQTPLAGECAGPASASLLDAQGNVAAAGAGGKTVSLSGGAQVTVYSDSACTASVTSVSVAQGSTSAGFYYRSTVAAGYTLTATSAGLTNGTLAVTVSPGAAASLAFTTTAQTVVAGTCSGVTTVQLRDAFGNAVKVGVDTPVQLSATPSAGFQFFTDAACTGTVVTSATMPANTSNASFYFKGTAKGGATLGASVGSSTGSQGVTINAAAPAVLAFSQPTLTVAAGDCTQVTVQVTDTYGNPATYGTNQNVSLAANPAAGFTFATANACGTGVSQVQLPSGQSSVSFYVKGTAAGSVTVTASKAGLTDGTLAVTVNAAAPGKLVFQTAPQTVEVATCSGLTTVAVQDSFGNPTNVTSDTLVNLTGSTANVTFYSDAGCNTAVTSTTVLAGQGSASFYFKDSAVEGVTLTAASTGLTNATQAETINPHPPTGLAFTTTAQTVQAGTCSGVMTVQTRAFGSATTVLTPVTVTLAASPSAGFGFYSNSGCTTPVTQVTITTGQSSTNFYFKGTKAGTTNIIGSSTGLADANQDETLTAQAPTKLVFTSSPLTTVAGACSAAVTVQPADTFGNISNVTGNTTVNLSQSAPTDPQFKFYSDSNCGTVVTSVSIPSGQNTVSFYYSGEKARTVTLTAAAGGLTSGTQDHTVIPTTVSILAFSSSTPAQTLLAGTCALRTVERQDVYGNPAPDPQPLTVGLGASPQADFFLDSNCTTPANQVDIPAGSGSANFYFKGISGGVNAAASLTLTASAAGFGSPSQIETILPTVRTGSCSIANNATINTCAIAPPLADMSKAFLVFQATSTNQASDIGNVRCYISSLSQLKCERGKTGGNTVNARWSIAEFPSGVAVQHASTVACGNDTTTVAVSPAVVKSRSFMLLSSLQQTNNQGSSVSRLAELTTTTQAEVRKPAGSGCAGNESNSLQVVDYPGASVQRGLSSMTSGTSAQASLSPLVAPDRSILLYSYNFTGAGTKICDRMVRGSLSTDGAKVNFSRGEGDATNCAGMQIPSISWEVVEFPPGTVVQQLTQPQAAGTATSTITLPITVDPSRTFVIAGGQWASGQVHGEGKYSGAESSTEMRAQAVLTDATTVTLTRQTSTSSATFTLFVVQLKP